MTKKIAACQDERKKGPTNTKNESPDYINKPPAVPNDSTTTIIETNKAPNTITKQAITGDVAKNFSTTISTDNPMTGKRAATNNSPKKRSTKIRQDIPLTRGRAATLGQTRTDDSSKVKDNKNASMSLTQADNQKKNVTQLMDEFVEETFREWKWLSRRFQGFYDRNTHHA